MSETVGTSGSPAASSGPSSRGRRGGRGRGRGGGRGRGRGRVRPITVPRSSENPSENGHHVGLQQRISTFTQALLASDPVIPGLDQTVIIPPRRLHLTLGVMSLDRPSSSEQSQSSQRPKTLESAKALLDELKPRVMEILAGEKLRVGLKRVDIMRPDRGDLERAHVMWVGPSHEDEDAKRLKKVSNFLSEEFKKAGLIIDDKRPLKLHTTIVNTIYRKPRGKGRTPFSYAAIIASEAFRAVERPPEAAAAVIVSEMNVSTSSTREKTRGRAPLHVDFGDWDVDEIQICEMGSHGPEGEYVCVGKISLRS
ncbi:hypothetical protein K474DRAFT_1686391 [Panus rudis PR-1116 ss-1]|nr:hypothetical protein K474DRAFT_1686391 [Panus rudis PR-1116 ss-1]